MEGDDGEMARDGGGGGLRETESVRHRVRARWQGKRGRETGGGERPGDTDMEGQKGR